MKKNKPECYKCKYRQTIPGDAHSKCTNPKSFDQLHIKANKIGIQGGWFCWPFNFDPVWLENCNGFKPNP